jgi:hypothetical protein
MLRRATIVSDVLMVVVAAVVATFVFEFGLLIATALNTADGAGLNGMFTSYGYITIEATFLCLILVGAYQVFRIGLRHRGGESDEDWDLIETDG